ncbi:MAG TPA: HAD family hydrolase [Candidatus Limnocylindria bacterium]
MPVEALFVDSAGVLLDVSALLKAWQRGVAEFCGPRLGGSAEQWAKANRLVEQRYFAWAREAAHADGGRGLRSFVRWSDERWIKDMCELVGVGSPADPIAFADACTRHITAGAGDTAYPDAVPAVRALATQVPRLFTATSQDERQIDGYLRAFGIRELFERTYGGDLVDRFKVNAAFFTDIMADADVAPERSALVDDNPRYLGWAREAGMKTYLLERRGEDPEGHELVPSLAALTDRLG